MPNSNEARWEKFVEEVAEGGLIWTIEKAGEYVTSKNRHGVDCFPWWSSRERVLKQLENVPAYHCYNQSGYQWETFLKEWVPSLKKAKCLLGVNYSGKANIGFDLSIEEVIQAVTLAQRNSI